MSIASNTTLYQEQPACAEAFDTELQIRVLPYVLGRRAGVPSRNLKRMECRASRELLDRLRMLDSSMRLLADSLCKELESVVACTTGTQRFTILNLRRDIYNGRAPKDSAIVNTLLQESLSHLTSAIREWLDMREGRNRLAKELELVFEREQFEARRVLGKCLRKSEFLNGLALASSDLSYECESYLRAEDPRSIQRYRRIERSLLRYYSRAALKVSPFSSFTRYFLLSFFPEQEPRPIPGTRRRSRIHRCIAINRAFVRHIAIRMAQDPILGARIPIRLNRNIAVREGNTLVLRHDYARARPSPMLVPYEHLLTLDLPSRLLDVVRRLLAKYKHDLPRQAVEDELMAIMSQRTHSIHLMERLRQLGILVHELPFPQDDSPGFELLKSFVGEDHSDKAAQLTSLFDVLEKDVSGLHRSASHGRVGLVNRIQRTSSQILTTLGQNSPWQGTLVYENCFEEPFENLRSPRQWSTVLEDIKQFVRDHGWLFDANVVYRDEIRNALVNAFDGGPVPLLHFIERFPKIPPAHSKQISRLEGLRATWGELISSSSSNDILDLREASKHARLREQLPAMLWPESVFSIACHCQPMFADNGQPSAVVDSFQGGFGRALLRAISVLPEPKRMALVDEVKRALRAAWPDALPCEMRATFDYNGNLHPLATDYFIDYPGTAQNGTSAIPLASLVLQLGARQELIIKDSRNGNRIIPLDLGSMASAFAPFGYALLSAFGNCNVMSKRLFHPYTWPAGSGNQAAVTQYPRLTYGSAVLRRKGWFIPAAHLPMRNPTDTDLQYFVRVHEWQKRHSLPDEIFVHAPAEGGSLPSSTSPRQAWSQRKPQYVNFASQLFVSIFENMVCGNRDLYFEEMLPTHADWHDIGLHRPAEYVVELWIQPTRNQ